MSETAVVLWIVQTMDFANPSDVLFEWEMYSEEAGRDVWASQREDTPKHRVRLVRRVITETVVEGPTDE